MQRFEEDMEITPDLDRVEYWVQKGKTLYNLGHYEESLAAYEEAIRLDPTYAIAWNNKGNAMGELGRHEEALSAYDEAIRLDPKYAAPWHNKGNALNDLGRHEEALSAFDEAIRLDPKDAFPWNGKGDALYDLGRHEEALSAYDEAIRLDPKDVAPWHNKGNALDDLGRHEEALSAYDEAIRLDPKHAFPWNGKGNALGELDRHEEALSAFDEAIRLDPKYAAPWHNKGNALYDLGRHKEALSAHDEAIRMDPKRAAPWSGKGDALNDLGRHEEALSAFDEAIRLDPKRAAPWSGKGNALYDLGRHKEALSAHDEAIRLDPKDAVPWNGKGNALNDLGRHEEALSAFDEAIRLDPKDAASWNGKGNALRGLGRHKEALSAFDEAIRLDPKRAVIWNNKGNALNDLGRHEEALRYYRRAVFLASPPRSLADRKVLGHTVLALHDAGGAGLLIERLVRWGVAPPGLLTTERILRSAAEETEVARALFDWMDEPQCSLRTNARLQLRGQVSLRFGDPIAAWQVLNELDDSEEGERALGGQIYLIWSMREFLEPNDGEVEFAYDQARKLLTGKWGPPDEMTCYYAGHIALMKDDLPMAREAFSRAGTEPASLLMNWHVARLSGDAEAAAEALDLLLVVERDCLRAGRTGILFPDPPAPFDPETSSGQAELQFVLRRFEVSGALADLLENVDLQQHPRYQELANDFREKTDVLDEIEQYENAVRTWKLKDEVKQKFERLQQTQAHQAAEKEMEERAKDFKFLEIHPPCSMQGNELVEHLARRLFAENLAKRRMAAVQAILLLMQQERLESEDAVLLAMYAHAKAHHDAPVAPRTVSMVKFVAGTVVGFLASRCGPWGAALLLGMLGGAKVVEKKLAAGAQIVWENLSDTEPFPTFPAFKEHIHRHWSESGDPDKLRDDFDVEETDET